MLADTIPDASTSTVAFARRVRWLCKGIARGLVRDAILHTQQAAEIAGIRALLVHALDEDAAAFYRHLGFVGPALDPLILMLPLATARKVLDA